MRFINDESSCLVSHAESSLAQPLTQLMFTEEHQGGRRGGDEDEGSGRDEDGGGGGEDELRPQSCNDTAA